MLKINATLIILVALKVIWDLFKRGELPQTIVLQFHRQAQTNKQTNKQKQIKPTNRLKGKQFIIPTSPACTANTISSLGNNDFQTLLLRFMSSRNHFNYIICLTLFLILNSIFKLRSLAQ